MAVTQWRKCTFFNQEVLKGPSGGPWDLLREIDVTCCASGHAQLVFGDAEGGVTLVSRGLEAKTFVAYTSRVTHLAALKQQNILVTVGYDGDPTGGDGVDSAAPLIKVWDLDKTDKETGHPLCTRISRALPAGRAGVGTVACIVVHEGLQHLALGFMDGTIVLFRGDVTKDRHSKPKVIHEDPDAITGLGFKQTALQFVVFASTRHHVLSFTLGVKSGEKIHKEILDEHGCKSKCAGITDSVLENQFLVGRQDAVYFYQPDGRGPCLAFEGEKMAVYWCRGYLVIVTKDNKPVGARGISPVGSKSTAQDRLTVYDIHNKFIAYSTVQPFPPILDVLCEWGILYIITGATKEERKVFVLHEKDMQAKLKDLFKKSMFDLAINLAKSQQYDPDGLIDIFRQYGDHLYSKRDYEGAIAQYMKTIGRLEPSYVIRKFLDAQRIHNLTAYLQALHKERLADSDHTTLLLNCYTKLKDVNQLDKFIDRDVDFDVETAIRVCRQAGYFKHALVLADKHQKHEFYLRIQLEDVLDYPKALSYIHGLDFTEAEANMKLYGKLLISSLPEETTAFLKQLCTDYKPENKESLEAESKRSSPEEFIHIFVNNSQKLEEFLVHMIQVFPESSSLVYNTLLELLLQQVVHEVDDAVRREKERRALELLQRPQAKYDIDHALILCQMNNFKDGILYLYGKAQLYQQIVRYHMDHNDYDSIIDTCKRYRSEPYLWVQALTYFAQREEDCKSHLIQVLDQIDEKNLIPPLLVIQTLAHNSTATLAVVKDYIIRRLVQEDEQIAEDERQIQTYVEGTSKIKEETHALKTKAKIFQVSKCEICPNQLDLPSVHFLCGHSYHQHCFDSYADNDQECLTCLPETRRIQDVIKAQDQQQSGRDLHEQFHHQLEMSSDGFSVVADYFGRGVFNKVTIIPDSSLSPSVSNLEKGISSMSLSTIRSNTPTGGDSPRDATPPSARRRTPSPKPKATERSSAGSSGGKAGSSSGAGVNASSSGANASSSGARSATSKPPASSTSASSRQPAASSSAPKVAVQQTPRTSTPVESATSSVAKSSSSSSSSRASAPPGASSSRPSAPPGAGLSSRASSSSVGGVRKTSAAKDPADELNPFADDELNPFAEDEDDALNPFKDDE